MYGRLVLLLARQLMDVGGRVALSSRSPYRHIDNLVARTQRLPTTPLSNK